MSHYNTYTLFKFINYISKYEESLIPIIKTFMIPNKTDYLFKELEFAKKIMYEVSDHNHLGDDDFLKKKYKQVYCPCYFNRKHKIFNNMKKRKTSVTIKIKSLQYNKDTFEKEYTVIYFINPFFSNETTVKEDELEKIDSLN